jgi:serine/threonine protein kinase
MLLGTAAYMSPEQAKGKPVDRRADIWAFGCVLFEILAGKPAFDG